MMKLLLLSLLRAAVELSAYLFNHHHVLFVFLVENVVITSIFLLCRYIDATSATPTPTRDNNVYEDYYFVMHRLRHSTGGIGAAPEERRIINVEQVTVPRRLIEAQERERLESLTNEEFRRTVEEFIDKIRNQIG